MKQTIISILLLASLTVAGQEPRIKLTENQFHGIIGAGSFYKNYLPLKAFNPTKTDLDKELKILGVSYGLSIVDALLVEGFKMAKDKNRPFDTDAFGAHIAASFGAAAATLFLRVTWHWILKPLFNGDLKFTAPAKYKW